MTESEILFIEKHFDKMQGPVLDVGSRKEETSHFDKRKIFKDKHYFGIDMREGKNVDEVVDITKDICPYIQKYNTVLMNSVLEHIDKPWLATDFIRCSLSHGGLLYISVPWVWRHHPYPRDLWRYSPSALEILFPWVNWLEHSFSHKGHEGFYKAPNIKRKFVKDNMLPITMLHSIGYAR